MGVAAPPGDLDRPEPGQPLGDRRRSVQGNRGRRRSSADPRGLLPGEARAGPVAALAEPAREADQGLLALPHGREVEAQVEHVLGVGGGVGTSSRHVEDAVGPPDGPVERLEGLHGAGPLVDEDECGADQAAPGYAFLDPSGPS